MPPYSPVSFPICSSLSRAHCWTILSTRVLFFPLFLWSLGLALLTALAGLELLTAHSLRLVRQWTPHQLPQTLPGHAISFLQRRRLWPYQDIKMKHCIVRLSFGPTGSLFIPSYIYTSNNGQGQRKSEWNAKEWRPVFHCFSDKNVSLFRQLLSLNFSKVKNKKYWGSEK